jgi:hypothetical protein
MGQYDRISGAQLRADLLRFSELILTLEREGRILRSAAELQHLLGELRQKLFAWEVRASLDPEAPLRQEADEAPGTGGSPSRSEREAGPPTDRDDGQLRQSLRVVREAIQRQSEMAEEWSNQFEGDPEEDEG